MALTKELGKITSAEYGLNRDYPYLIGLELYFSLSGGSSVGDGGRYLINVYDGCKWDSFDEKANAFIDQTKSIRDVLEDAKVDKVSQLVGKPVEVVIDANTFQSFRILTEVL